ncbi:Uncharacterized protein ALO71_03709 [Pseudomonas amygdali pv. dendropanacis]|uniref:Uncharacterized protein n=1 Tax=Pseudomonas amygdali pv. dendropanacis TaxID=235272 RepID=A0A0P9PZ40_PSEA0|nr:hypothetical protein [Pseudomonas amygdali]KPX23930.1 Uncharacterized protein ALO71_03709 [Pseudomonas amygdali pv. dendropanacis]KWS86543.1 hypothetical protein AL051_14680 [Pseudomonas amygdali pv. dendropanacis]
MTELQHVVSLSELYERLIDRLGLALETASTSVRLRNESPAELELKGLSSAELQLIEAYLEKGLRAADVAVREQLVFQLDLGRPSRASATIIWLKDRRRGKGLARLGRNS